MMPQTMHYEAKGLQFMPEKPSSLKASAKENDFTQHNEKEKIEKDKLH